MKNLLLLIVLILCLSFQQKEKKYTIIGNTENIPNGTIINLFRDYGNISTSIKRDTIINGVFNFEGILDDENVKMYLQIENDKQFNGVCELWVDDKIIKVSANSNLLSSWIVDSKNLEQINLNKFIEKTRNTQIQIDSLELTRNKNRQNKKLSKKILKLTDSLNQLKQEIEFKLIEKNPNSKSAVKLFYENSKFNSKITKQQIENIYNSLTPKYKETLYGEGIYLILNPPNKIEIGNKMVNFKALDKEGLEHSLTDFKGKYILLDFWSVGCGPCHFAMPETKKIDSMNREILTVISISIDTNNEIWKKISEHKKINWINLYDGKGYYGGAANLYSVNGIPSYFLINPEGIIIDKWKGYSKGSIINKLKNHINNFNDN
ncbi:TlpA family protein disulfide reductase [Wenyingzhuangia marina]|uniref:Peroxiredoxin n=1 Tax=Wenyingzhuangia marina TaxID=1195760 RepID=A0A1M5U4C1_9FLAO|nr:TlpA disulfide reductase family protein [Wenyingzhuangia marina]GGF69580.1 hypothetical protein GCM10011397_10650 [Wenyingzhuangia marina]SHH57945.1 Peroxiredoxin [Wenyingzhuangia marina]